MDFDAAPIWTKQHTFLQPVIFSPKQVFSGVNIKFSDQNRGSVLFCDGREWKTIPIGNYGQVLTVTNGVPGWGAANVSAAIGVLKPENGGTGRASYDSGAILYASSKTNLDALPSGKDGQVLVSQGQKPCWSDFQGVKGSGKAARLAVWSSNNDICETDIQVDGEKLVLKNKNSKIHLGAAQLNVNGKNFTISFDKDSLVVTKDTFAIQSEGQTVVKFWRGKMSNGIVPMDRLEGTLSTQQGGTGLSQYTYGDILYASSQNTISTLSVENAEGQYLKVVNGRPQWSSLDIAPTKTTNDSTFELSKGTLQRAPLKFVDGQLTSKPHAGAVEWDGDRLYITTKNGSRRSVVFSDENISGTAKGVSEKVSLKYGGLGADLTNAPVGSLLIMDSLSTVGVITPETGKFLRSHPESTALFWSHAVVEVAGGNGVLVNKSNKYSPIVSIDQTSNFSPAWQAQHHFVKGISIGEENTLHIPRNKISGLPQIHFESCAEPKQKREGDVWFDNDLFMYVNGATVNLTRVNERTNSIAQVQHLRICEGVSPISNTRRRIKYPLPYGSDGRTKVKWKFVRADLRIEECPQDTAAQLRIYVNDIQLLENALSVSIGSQATETQQFIMPYAHSGDLISVEFGDTGGGDCWSLYLTVISDNF